MKKILGIVLCLVLLLSYAVAEGVDLKSMSDEELNDLQNAIIAEQCERGGFDSTQVITPGEYVVGRDIRSGQFKFKAIRMERYSQDNRRALPLLLEVEDTDENIGMRFSDYLDAGDTVTITLVDGETLIVYYGECLIEEIKPSFTP